MVTDAFPANITFRSEPATISEPCFTRAQCTEPIVSALFPQALDNLIRSLSPPRIGLTTMRTVRHPKAIAGGRPGNGSGACTAVLHALTQCPTSLAFPAQLHGPNAVNRKSATTTNLLGTTFSFRAMTWRGWSDKTLRST